MNSDTPENKNNAILKKYGKSFCAAPFTSFHEGENGLISTCCKTRNPLGFTSQNTVEEILNSAEAQKIRKEFLEGKRPEQCKACWNLEESGKIASNRLHSNDMGAAGIDEAVANTNENGYMNKQFPTWLDILWTNKCNFACIGCKPSLSSTIANNYIKEFSILHNHDYAKEQSHEWKNSNDSKIDYVLKHSDSIHTIHLNGGEPLMAEDLYEFLEVMISKGLHKKIKIWSHTNGSVKSFKGRDLILDYFSHWGKNCKITLSNDGHSKYGEYIRYGYNDKKWLNTYEKIKEAKIEFNVQTCLNIFNVLYLDEINDWYFSNIIDNEKIPYGTLTLWTNPTLSIRLANHIPELREQSLNMLTQLQSKKSMQWNKSLVSSHQWLENNTHADQHHLKSFYNGVVALDAKRNTNFLETFPLLTDLYNLGKSI
jgi:organic radical activating enzyme